MGGIGVCTGVTEGGLTDNCVQALGTPWSS